MANDSHPTAAKVPARASTLRSDFCPSIEGCCDDACCYLDWLIGRGEDRP